MVMKKEFLSARESSVYPGLYTPVCEISELQSRVPGDKPVSTLSDYTLDEYPDHFVIEIPAPGVSREHIFVSAHTETISVFIKNIQYHIPLRKPIDTGFISANFYKGLLHIYVPKAIGVWEMNDQEGVFY